MTRTIRIGTRDVGDGQPVYVVAEIGINHNGSVDIAKRLIDAAKHAGCDAVKFQKRTPEICVPADQRDMMRTTPWGYVSYLDYRHRIELGLDEFREIDAHCRAAGITWFVSCWDEPSVAFMDQFDTPCHKIPSACLTDAALLRCHRATGRPLVLSTGMSSMSQIRAAVGLLGTANLLLTHCTSTYPCHPSELNLKMLQVLRTAFPCPVGYSGHEVGLAPTVAAAALGACFIERHITLDRAMWGSDHAASVEPGGFERLVRYIRLVEESMGTGEKEVYQSEVPILRRLRRVDTLEASR